MTSLRLRGVAALMVVACAFGCKKEGSGDRAELPADLTPHPASGDPSKLVVPALFANVPADTPYLFASLDAIPPEFYAKLKQAFGPLFELAFRQGRALGDDNPLLAAILGELDGKWNQAGLEALGFSAEPRFALYGLGLSPVVLRLAVKDDKALRATIERIAARAGASLPPMATKDGRSYWKIDIPDGPALVIALAESQLIAAIGSPAKLDAKLGLILGTEKPAQTMADGKLVKELMARHGFGGQLIGVADTRQIASQALEAAGAKSGAVCTAEVDRLSTKLPRVAMGYGELSASKTSGGMVVELSPDAIADLKALRVEIPGLAQLLSGTPLVAMGGGVDLARAQQVAIAIAANLRKLGAACELGPLADGADRMSRTLSAPLPEPAGRIAGGAIAVEDVKFSGGRRREPIPDNVEGVALIASPDARALFDKAVELAPSLKALGVAADGKLHDLPQGTVPVPFPLAAGVGDKLIVLTAGTQQKPRVEKLIGAHGGGKAPLFAMSYDSGKVFDLELQMFRELGAADPAMMGVFHTMRRVFGRVSGTLDVTDQGLVFWGTLELR
ncbi:MAG TPA: hypothetical protein VF469_17880 [Kofleriaceae bacterium]